MSGFYDLLDVIYFRKYETSPRKIVNESIKAEDKILDLCTGTGTNAVNLEYIIICLYKSTRGGFIKFTLFYIIKKKKKFADFMLDIH